MPLGLVFALGLLAVVAAIRWPVIEKSVDTKPIAVVAADNMRVWHQAAIEYVASNPTYTGTIAGTSLVLPEWYALTGTFVSVADGTGRVVTYTVAGSGPAAAGPLAWELQRRMPGFPGIGVSSGGQVVDQKGTTSTLPAGIPNGVAVMVTRAG